MPSMYQLLPHPEGDWMIGIDGRKINLDLYSLDTWKEYRWSIYDPKVRQTISEKFVSEKAAERYLSTLEDYFEKRLRRAKKFHQALSAEPPVSTTQVQFILFGGDCSLTPARCLVEEVDNKTMIRLQPDEILRPVAGVDYERLMLEPGDGSVTKPSLLGENSLDPSNPESSKFFPVAYSVFLCEDHTKIPGDLTFQDNLLNVLLTQETTEDRMRRPPGSGKIP